MTTTAIPAGRIRTSPAGGSGEPFAVRRLSAIRVLVVDGHPVARWKLGRIADEQPDMQTIGLTGSAAEALHLTAALVPDVITIDTALPDRDGVELALELRARYPRLGIVIVTAHDEDDSVSPALHIGASAFVGKLGPTTDTVDAIRRCAVIALSSSADGVVRAARGNASTATARLTAAEMKVLANSGAVTVLSNKNAGKTNTAGILAAVVNRARARQGGGGHPASDDSAPRVAVVHDYLTQLGGAERVALAMIGALPDARIITSCYSPRSTFPEFGAFDVETMRLNRWRALRHDPRLALPVLARSFDNHRVSDVDVVLCSSSGWSHGIATDAPKIVYCHNPARWLYQSDDYFGRLSKTLRGAFERHAVAMRQWDKMRASEAAVYLVNSTVVQERVRRHYGIEARLLPPPPGVTPQGPMEPIPGLAPGFLLSVARPRGYKHVASVALAVESLPGERLVAVGGLPQHPDGRQWSSRLIGLPRASDAQLRWLYANAAALVTNSQEDFGLTPIEAFGFGTPVLAIRMGGYLDTCVAGLTGLWIDDHSPDAVIDAIERFRAESFDPFAIKAHGARWSPQRFACELASVIDEVAAGRRANHIRTGELAYPLRPSA